MRSDAARPPRARRCCSPNAPEGTFTRQLFLGETLDADRIDASYEAGVLTLTIPVAERAKPRRIQISGGGDRRQLSG
ncbi:hypothetical protein GCM10017687_69470 [Streptomyces echinatus]